MEEKRNISLMQQVLGSVMFIWGILCAVLFVVQVVFWSVYDKYDITVLGAVSMYIKDIPMVSLVASTPVYKLNLAAIYVFMFLINTIMFIPIGWNLMMHRTEDFAPQTGKYLILILLAGFNMALGWLALSSPTGTCVTAESITASWVSIITGVTCFYSLGILYEPYYLEHTELKLGFVYLVLCPVLAMICGISGPIIIDTVLFLVGLREQGTFPSVFNGFVITGFILYMLYAYTLLFAMLSISKKNIILSLGFILVISAIWSLFGAWYIFGLNLSQWGINPVENMIKWIS